MDSGSLSWMMVCTALVLFMTPGLALFYGGLTRTKSTLNMMMMSLWCILVVPLVWVVLGYTLAFRSAGPFIGNLSAVGLRVDDETEVEGLDRAQHAETAYHQAGLAVGTRS